VLFNLGHVYHELGHVREALAMFQRSRARSQTVDSIVRKLYAMIAQCHRTLGEHAQALAACKAGREYYPDDCELLFQTGLALLAHRDLAGAEQSFLQLIHRQEGAHFGSLDTGLKGYKARHNLAVIYVEQGRLVEAEAQWRAALAEHPGFAPALMGLEHLGRQRALAS
jgi:tetratricopeptide (TPR) repeat protein